MNLIEKTLKDSAWYWAPAQQTGPDGLPVFATAQLLTPPAGGRWDDNPTRVMGPNGEVIQINVRFTTVVPVVAGGWLLKAGDEGTRHPQDGDRPNQFPLAREIHTVTTARNYRRTVVYYTGLIK